MKAGPTDVQRAGSPAPWRAGIIAAGHGKRLGQNLPKALTPVAGRVLIDFALNGLQAAGATLPQYAKWTYASMLRLADVKNTAEEKTAVAVAPGSYSSNCGQHIAMLNGPWFGTAQTGNATVEIESGTPLTLHDALGAWATGTPIAAVDTHPSTVSFCPPTTSDQ